MCLTFESRVDALQMVLKAVSFCGYRSFGRPVVFLWRPVVFP